MNEFENLTITNVGSYNAAFAEALRLKNNNYEILMSGMTPNKGAYYVPSKFNEKLASERSEFATLRSLATVFKHYTENVDIISASSDDGAEFIPEGEMIPGFEADNDFTKLRLELHKAAVLVKVADELVYDKYFDIESYLTKRMARSFAKAEDKAFINGTGINEPTGLLHETNGAEVADTVDSLTYDDVIGLFFAVKPEYRKNAVWMMNDATALNLRKLKDADGNYLWNQMSDTILGKPVVICNNMPDAESGKKPILFGDLSYYWIIDRSPISMKVLKELFAVNHQIGYVGHEFLDAKLTCREAVKGIRIK